MLISVLLGLTLVGTTTYVHFHVLHLLSGAWADKHIRADRRILYAILVLFGTHILEVILYAATYWVALERLGVGAFTGATNSGPLELFYISIVSYTSLGIGDIAPIGHIRFIVGVEALNGLLLIAWSASFMYMMMQQHWRSDRC
tara:strand:+ start:237 stop:668 length:432 start_codon:yes stop_codon:yes gene_type:complete